MSSFSCNGLRIKMRKGLKRAGLLLIRLSSIGRKGRTALWNTELFLGSREGLFPETCLPVLVVLVCVVTVAACYE